MWYSCLLFFNLAKSRHPCCFILIYLGYTSSSKLVLSGADIYFRIKDWAQQFHKDASVKHTRPSWLVIWLFHVLMGVKIHVPGHTDNSYWYLRLRSLDWNSLVHLQAAKWVKGWNCWVSESSAASLPGRWKLWRIPSNGAPDCVKAAYPRTGVSSKRASLPTSVPRTAAQWVRWHQNTGSVILPF